MILTKRANNYSIRIVGKPTQQYRLPFIVPAPLLFYSDLFKKLITCLYSVAQEVANRTFTPHHPPGAVKYGIREKIITSIFGIKIHVKVQRFLLPDGRTASRDLFTLSQGIYDINLVFFAVTLYSNGVPSHMVAAILHGYFCVDVSVGTILNWVKLVGENGYQEHRWYMKKEQKSGRYSPKQIGTDEIYFTMAAEDKPLGISYLVDLKSSAIIDVYSFRGRNISKVDVDRLYRRNREYFDSIEIVTTDGAKPYEYFVELKKSAVHVVCIQHKARNIRKTAIVKKLIREKMLEETSYQARLIGGALSEHKEMFQGALDYILPPVLPKSIRENVARSGTETFLEQERALLDAYKQRLQEHLNAYRAYVHHRLYVTVQAALVGKLRLLYRDMRKEHADVDGALKWANEVVYSTAMIEGMNRPLRNRVRRAIRYRDDELAVAVAKLYMLQHNTLSRTRERVRTPYEDIGIPIMRMVWNPFRPLYIPNRGISRVPSSNGYQTSQYIVKKQIFGQWYSKRVELRSIVNRSEDRKYVEAAIEATIGMRDRVLNSLNASKK